MTSRSSSLTSRILIHNQDVIYFTSAILMLPKATSTAILSPLFYLEPPFIASISLPKEYPEIYNEIQIKAVGRPNNEVFIIELFLSRLHLIALHIGLRIWWLRSRFSQTSGSLLIDWDRKLFKEQEQVPWKNL